MKISKLGITFGIAVAAILSIATLSSAQIAPIAGTGWNQDLVVENTSDFTWPAAAAATSGDVVGFVWYESGWGSSSQGLSSGGMYTGPSGASYDIPDYNANNAILNSGTLALSTPGQFSDLAFLVTTQAGGGDVFWDATVNFSDSSSTVLNGSGVDWINTSSTEVVVSGHGLGNPGGQSFYDGNLFMVERLFTLSVADQLKTVTTIDFNMVTPGTNSVLHAISGAPAASVPEPTSVAILGLSMLGVVARRRRVA